MRRKRRRSAASPGALTIFFSLLARRRPLLRRSRSGATSLIKDRLGSPFLFWLVEGVLRTAIFIGYLAAISRLPRPAAGLRVPRRRAQDDLLLRGGRRAGPGARQDYSRLHPRCGTSFLLIVMVLAIFVFAPIGLPAWYWLVASRILGIPLIAGLSYEVIKWAGKHRSKRWVRGDHVAGPDAPEPDHPGARSRPARGRDRVARGRARRRGPRTRPSATRRSRSSPRGCKAALLWSGEGVARSELR